MFRTLFRKPGQTVVVIATLAVTLGATLVVYRAVDAVLLRPLPFPNSDQLVKVREWNEKGNFDSPVSAGTFQEWRRRALNFSGLSCYRTQRRLLLGENRPRSVWLAMVSPGFFTTLGVQPQEGTGFREESLQGTFADRDAVLSHRLWQVEFSGSTDAIGKLIRLDEDIYRIVGVMPSDFAFPSGVDVWVPLVFNQAVGPRQRTVRDLEVVGRIKTGVSLASAAEDLGRISSLLTREFPHSNQGWGVQVILLKESLVGHLRPALYLLTAGIVCLLAVACFGLLHLLLAREISRSHEVAIAYSLGATPSHRFRRSFLELLPICAVGAGLGLIGAHWTLGVFAVRLREILAGVVLKGLDLSSSVVALLLCVGMTALLSLPSALSPSARSLAEALKGGHTMTESRRFGRISSLLLFVQALGASVLLIFTACIAKSFINLYTVDLGTDPGRTWVAGVDTRWPPQTRPWEGIVRFIEGMREQVSGMPGIESVAAANYAPFEGRVFHAPFRLAPFPGSRSASDRQAQPDAFSNAYSAALIKVSPGYFATLGIPRLRGRVFNNLDRLLDFSRSPDTVGHAVVNEAFARRYLSDQDGAAGLEINLDWVGWREIVGIVGNTRNSDPLTSDQPEIYVPFAESPDGGIFLLLRTAGTFPPSWSELQRRVQTLHREAVVAELSSLEERIDAYFLRQRVAGMVFSAFSLISLFLVLLGLYGVTAHLAARQQRAILIRVALGASYSDVIRLLIPRALKPTLIGVGAGVGAAAVFASPLEHLFFGSGPADPPVLLSAAALLLATCTVASALPILRAFPKDVATVLKTS